jgi:hypothetical protein
MVHIGSGALLLLFIPAPLIVTTPHHSALFHRHPQSFKLPLPSHSICLLSSLQPPHHRHHCSTCDPPHEQLLVGLEVGGALSSVVRHSFVVLCHSFIVVCRLLYVIRSSLSVVSCTLFVRRCQSSVVCRSFVVISHQSYVVRSSSSVICCTSFVCRRQSSIVCRSFVVISRQLSVVRSSSSVIRRLASVVPTYPPCEQWLAAAGVGADM